MLAAATAFAERGFHATTTRDIAAQAGLSSAALYFYFRSKEEVLYQIATSALDLTIEVAATEAKGPGLPAERLTNLVRVLTIWHTYNSQVAHVVLYRTSALTTAHLADIAAKQREVSQIVRQVITDGVTSGDFDVPRRWRRHHSRLVPVPRRGPLVPSRLPPHPRSNWATSMRSPPSALLADARRLDLPGDPSGPRLRPGGLTARGAAYGRTCTDHGAHPRCGGGRADRQVPGVSDLERYQPGTPAS